MHILIPCHAILRYVICGDQVLRVFTRMRPSNTHNMSLVDGVNTVHDLIPNIFLYVLNYFAIFTPS